MLGRDPIDEQIILTLGADFTLKINAPDNVLIPAGTAIYIEFYPPARPNTLDALDTWNGAVSSEFVEWRIESTLANDIPDKARFRIYVSYPDTPNTLEHCWYRGSVTRRQ